MFCIQKQSPGDTNLNLTAHAFKANSNSTPMGLKGLSGEHPAAAVCSLHTSQRPRQRPGAAQHRRSL